MDGYYCIHSLSTDRGSCVANWHAHKTEPEIYGFEILSPAYRPGPASPVNLGIVKIGGDDHHKIGGAEPLSLDPGALSQAAARAVEHHPYMLISHFLDQFGSSEGEPQKTQHISFRSDLLSW